MVDMGEKLFTCGLQVERGYVKAPREYRDCALRSDWDWHWLLTALKPKSRMERELKRLLQEGFAIHAGSWDADRARFSGADFPGVLKLRRALEGAPQKHWAGFQLYYPMAEGDVRSATGVDLVEAMLAVFSEVTPAMNLCMQIELEDRSGDD
jgi:hypothetical protein